MEEIKDLLPNKDITVFNLAEKFFDAGLEDFLDIFPESNPATISEEDRNIQVEAINKNYENGLDGDYANNIELEVLRRMIIREEYFLNILRELPKDIFKQYDREIEKEFNKIVVQSIEGVELEDKKKIIKTSYISCLLDKIKKE